MKNRLVCTLVEYNLISDEEISVYEYGIFVILFNLLCIFIALCIGVLFGKLKFSILLFFFYTPIRILLGGHHCKNSKSCICLFETIFTLLLLFNQIFDILVFKKLICLLIILAYLHNCFIDKQIYNSKCPIVLFIILLLYFVLIPTVYGNVICNAFLMNILLYYMKFLFRPIVCSQQVS